MQAMARPILPLSDHLINQIAAGEVIERPASVIKELVENSFDAGATRVDIDIGDGGLEYMSVSDDGSGLAGAELAAALRRHWTSKIAAVSDLASLVSLGFRGEALASIAAVATVEIITRRRGDPHGWRLAVAPGQTPGPPVPHQANVGTRLTVRELFDNVPARRRFLKRARTEFLHIQQLVRQLAFARPAVAMSLSQAGSRGLRLPSAELGVDSPRWRSLFGAPFMAAAHFVELDAQGLSVRGWVGGPDEADSQSDGQFLSLNGRYVRDRQLAHAVRLAFGDGIPSGRFPVYALAVALTPAAVDVNVHPGKLEVRFADVRAVHDLLYVAVRRALAGVTQPESSNSPQVTISEPAGRYAERSQEHRTPSRAPALHGPLQLGPALALIDDRYLLYRDNASVRALDLRAAWTEILTRRLVPVSATGVASRPLLIPERIAAASRLWAHYAAAQLRAYGFELDDLGPAGHLLRAVPRVLPELPWPAFFERLAEQTDGDDDGARFAQAAAAAVVLGSHGLASRRLLDALEHGAAACGFELTNLAAVVDGALLARRGVVRE